MGQTPFSNEQFVNLLRSSAQQAFEYRFRAANIEIPETYGSIKLNTSLNKTLKNDWKNEEIGSISVEEEIQQEEIKKDTEEEVKEVQEIQIEITQPSEYTREELREKLKKAKIIHFPGAKIEKLAELCVNNKLI